MAQSPGASPGRLTAPVVIGLLAGAGALLAVAGFAGVRRAASVLTMLIAASFLAIGLERPVLALTSRGMRRPIAVVVVIAGLAVLVLGLLALAVVPLTRQLSAFFADGPDLAARIAAQPAVREVADATDLETELAAAVTPANAAAAVTGVLGAVGGVLGAVAAGVSTVVLSVFVLAGLDRVRAGAYSLVAASRRDRVRLLAEAVQEKIGQYLVGAVTIAAIAGAAAFLWTSLTGVPYPVVMALVVAGFDLVPQIGAFLGSTIVTLTALSTSLSLAIATVVFFCCYQALENWVIYPRVMSRAVEISALAALVSAMVGFAMFGVLGVLLAVPVFGSIQLLVRELVLGRQASR